MPETRSPPVAVLVHLSGSRRGTMETLEGSLLPVGSGTGCRVAFDPTSEPAVATHHAALERRDSSWELRAESGNRLFVNGQPVESRVLESGDVIEIGNGGPVLRFRLYEPGRPPRKTLAEVFSDCVGCARYGGRSFLERTMILLAGVPFELATQTTLAFRGAVLLTLTLVIATLLFLAQRSFRLEERFLAQTMAIDGIAELVHSSGENRITGADLQSLRTELDAALDATLDSRLAAAEGRITSLETQAAATAEVIAEAADATLFLQGSYGFVEPGSGRVLRFALGPDGNPFLDPTGTPRVTLGGSGPAVESSYTGTGFVATAGGLVFTNRHVALPWELDAVAQAVTAQGLEPVMNRLVGFLPGVPEPFDVEVVAASEAADVALLRCSGATETVTPLALSASPPRPGDEVVVLGYPTGMRALLARTDQAVLAQLMGAGELDFWQVARRLARLGAIAPLATRGIVGQVTSAAVVYDAETTSGGSGGPVLNLDGLVVAVNAAILPEFGGSNLGVPAVHAKALLEAAAP